MSEDMNQGRTFEVLTAQPVRKQRKPRHWTADEKALILEEALTPGANVSAVARAHGLDPSQVHGWRRAALEKMPPNTILGPAGRAHRDKEVEGIKDAVRRWQLCPVRARRRQTSAAASRIRSALIVENERVAVEDHGSSGHEIAS